MVEKQLKNYVVIYQSQEHYEVLGYLKASNMKEAIGRAKTELKMEARKYEVREASIGEVKSEEKITFDIE